MTVLEILRLTEKGYSQRQIAKSVKCSKTTIYEIQKRCRQIGLSYSQATKLSGPELKKVLYPLNSERKKIQPDPDFASIQDAMQKDSKKILQYMWENYRSDNPEGLSAIVKKKVIHLQKWITFIVVRPAWAQSNGWKSRTRPVVGSV